MEIPAGDMGGRPLGGIKKSCVAFFHKNDHREVWFKKIIFVTFRARAYII
jgi:hypothetical protein